MLDPNNAAVLYTPMGLANQNHLTLGRLSILPLADVGLALEPEPAPGDHVVHARPLQRQALAEAVRVVPEGEDDPIRGALMTATRLIALDGLDARTVFGVFAAHLEGWTGAVADGRIRQAYRLSR